MSKVRTVLGTISFVVVGVVWIAFCFLFLAPLWGLATMLGQVVNPLFRVLGRRGIIVRSQDGLAMLVFRGALTRK